MFFGRVPDDARMAEVDIGGRTIKLMASRRVPPGHWFFVGSRVFGNFWRVPVDKPEMDNDSLVVGINRLRRIVKNAAEEVKLVADQCKPPSSIVARTGEDRGEIIANLMLAYRHLEDASMRLGKAIQARDGGTSVYDKSTTVGA